MACGCGSTWSQPLFAALILSAWCSQMLQGAVAVATVTVSALPRHPEDACASAEVTQVLTGCKFSGASSDCCQRLDAVFYDTSSLAAGCLCYPTVLYKVIEKASQTNFNVLRMLKDCSQQYQARTDWAMRPDTTCPSLELNATKLDIAMQFGDAVLLDSAQSKPIWAWNQLLQGGKVMAFPTITHGLLSQRVVGLGCVQFLLVILISMPPLFFTMHKLVLVRFSSVYRGLNTMQQLVTCQHAAYALLFTLQLVPQTVIAFRFLFKAWTGDYIASQELSLLVGVFILSRAALYLIEACVRSVHTSWLLLVHHQLFFTIILMGVWTENTALLSIGVVLDLFACHEALLYVALVSYRLKLNVAFTRIVLYTSCTWYTLTRVFQTVILVYMIVCWASNPDVKLTPGFIITSMLCGAFTVIQAYTLVIYRAMGLKILSRDKGYKSDVTELPYALSYSGKWASSDSANTDFDEARPGEAVGNAAGKLHVSDSAKDVARVDMQQIGQKGHGHDCV